MGQKPHLSRDDGLFAIAMCSSTLYRMACEHHKLAETLFAADGMRKEVGKITYIAKHAQRSDR